MKILAAVSLTVISLTALTGCGGSDDPAQPEPPAALADPWPAHGATRVGHVITLSWHSSGTSGGTLTYDVYFDTVSPPTTRVAAGQLTAALPRSGLAYGTDYHWRVDVHHSQGTTVGPVWSFTTGSGAYAPALVTVTGGSFAAGGTTTVTISSFQMDCYEITYEMWTDVRTWGATHGYTDLVAGQNGWNQVAANNPVVMVNWYDAVKWCNARSEMDGLVPVYCTDGTRNAVYRTGEIALDVDAVKWDATGYRLPTEAERDFAARGGTASRAYTYSGSSIIDNVAWYDGNSGNMTHPVGMLSANEIGLYDMSGNVGEFCWDWFTQSYPAGGVTDPRGSSTAQTFRVLRGGFCFGEAITCDLGTRAYDANGPAHRSLFGFRCVRK